MGQEVRNWFWNNFFGPQNARRFALRISIRVWFLRQSQDWRNRSLTDWLKTHLPRPIFVFAVSLAVIASMALASIPLGNIGEKLRALLNGKGEALSWQTALILFGAPIAFILWTFRDFNVQATLENQRKDINLKEFQEIQMRAAGALAENLPDEARQTMQVAAIHQLLPFLCGDYGASFRRPAWEVLKARLKTSARESGMLDEIDWSEQARREASQTGSDYGEETTPEIDPPLDGPVAQAEQALLAEGAVLLFRPNQPVSGGHYGGVRGAWQNWTV